MKKAPSTPAAPALTPVQKLVKRIAGMRAQGRALYRAADDLFLRLRVDLPVGEKVTLEDGRTFAIADAFAEKPTGFKTVGFDRFELREVK